MLAQAEDSSSKAGVPATLKDAFLRITCAGNEFESEALAGALPTDQNNPRVKLWNIPQLNP